MFGPSPPSQKVRSLEEDGGPLVAVHGCPRRLGSEGRFDAETQFLLRSQVRPGQDAVMVVGAADLVETAGLDGPAVDDEGHLINSALKGF